MLLWMLFNVFKTEEEMSKMLGGSRGVPIAIDGGEKSISAPFPSFGIAPVIPTVMFGWTGCVLIRREG